MGNQSLEGNGGAIYFYVQASGTILGSVITNNNATSTLGNGFSGGIYLAQPQGMSSQPVIVVNTIIGKNTALQATGKDVYGQNGRSFTSGGNNRLTIGGYGFTNGLSGDYVNTRR